MSGYLLISRWEGALSRKSQAEGVEGWCDGPSPPFDGTSGLPLQIAIVGNFASQLKPKLCRLPPELIIAFAFIAARALFFVAFVLDKLGGEVSELIQTHSFGSTCR